MNEFIEIGMTALRDEQTGEFLPPVPIFIRAEDIGKVSAPPPGAFDNLAKYLGEKIKAYQYNLKNASDS